MPSFDHLLAQTFADPGFASVASNIQSSNSLKSLTITHLLKPFSLMTAHDNNSKHNKTVTGIARDSQ
jgi:hypothetical protein